MLYLYLKANLLVLEIVSLKIPFYQEVINVAHFYEKTLLGI